MSLNFPFKFQLSRVWIFISWPSRFPSCSAGGFRAFFLACKLVNLFWYYSVFPIHIFSNLFIHPYFFTSSAVPHGCFPYVFVKLGVEWTFDIFDAQLTEESWRCFNSLKKDSSYCALWCLLILVWFRIKTSNVILIREFIREFIRMI